MKDLTFCRLTIIFPQAVNKALHECAEAEIRDVHREALYLIVEELKQKGFLPHDYIVSYEN